MSIFHSMNTTASALTAQRMRMDVISSNMANADTTRANYVNGEWQPYRSKTVVLQPKENTFSNFLNMAIGEQVQNGIGNGVKVTGIVEDDTPFNLYMILSILMQMKKDMWKCQMLIHLRKW